MKLLLTQIKTEFSPLKLIFIIFLAFVKCIDLFGQNNNENDNHNIFLRLLNTGIIKVENKTGHSFSHDTISISLPSQVVIGFNAPDTTCVNHTINIENTTTGGTTYYWNFCSGNANFDPSGINIGNPGNLLSIPTYITLVKEENECFSFISCQGVGVVQYYHGGSFKNNPLSWTNLGTFGIISFNQEGIQVVNDNGQWYGFVCSYSTVVRLTFGNSLWNSPTADDLNINPPFVFAHGLIIIKENNTWIGFITDSNGNKLFRLNFGSTLSSDPALEDLGNPGGFITPGQICLVEEDSSWYMLMNAGANTLSRLNFGNSLLNFPTGENLGNPGGFNIQSALTVIRDCQITSGYFCNYLVNGQLGKLNFPNGVSGSVTGQILGNIGGLNKPHCFSEIFRINDSLYAYITNRGNGTLTRLTFPPCNNASVASSTEYNPPPFSYNNVGTYNVRLIVDEGLSTQEVLCKQIVVMNPPEVDLGPDTAICPGIVLTLDAGAGFSTYLWSTGNTTRTISVSQAGIYWVQVSRWGCTGFDTILISSKPAPLVNLGPDTTICSGNIITFNAGICFNCTYLWANLTTGQINIGNGQTYSTGTAGEYMVTVTNDDGCTSKDTIQLFVNPTPLVTTFPTEKNICSQESTNILLSSNEIGVNFHWTASLSSGNVTGFFPDSGLIINQILNNPLATPGVVIYHIWAKKGNCVGPSVDFVVYVNPLNTVFISITSSKDTICEGDEVSFSAFYDNGGTDPIFSWFVNGSPVGNNSPVFTFIPNNSDYVSCVLNSSSSTCIMNNPDTSNVIAITVNPYLAVSISFVTEVNPVCDGTSVTYTAIWSNGGTTPVFQWRVNGFNVGTNSPTFSFIPNNGDIVTCELQSSEYCTTENPVISSPVTMSVIEFSVAEIMIAASSNPFCSGSEIQYIATSFNGGNNPFYQWKVNDIDTGNNSPYYSHFPIQGDEIRCLMTSSQMCILNNPVSSNSIVMDALAVPDVHFFRCFDSITVVNAKPFTLKYGLPLGGTYSGPGVDSITGIFNPSLAGIGTKIITYSYTNTYHCRASKTSSIMVQNTQSFNCGNNFVDIRDNQPYPTIQVGSKCWMRANLNYGTIIPSTTYQTDNCIPEKYCVDNSLGNCNMAGAFYQWDELIQYGVTESPDYQGICPPGWHIPSFGDFQVLIDGNLGDGLAGFFLRDMYLIPKGFEAILMGMGYLNTRWSFKLSEFPSGTFFWTSTPGSANKIITRGLNEWNQSVSKYESSKSNAFPVRCIKD